MSAQATLTASAPVLLVKNVVKAANHYRDAMGFAINPMDAGSSGHRIWTATTLVSDRL